MGLKRVNDTKGHKEGDNLLFRACECLKRCLGSYELFRIGGDEFVALCKEVTERKMQEHTEALRKDMVKNDALMAIGNEWNAKYDNNIDQLLIRADSKMYEDKRRYYVEK